MTHTTSLDGQGAMKAFAAFGLSDGYKAAVLKTEAPNHRGEMANWSKSFDNTRLAGVRNIAALTSTAPSVTKKQTPVVPH